MAKQLLELKKDPLLCNERGRRWFSSTELDLIVWHDTEGSIAGFEFYYDKTVNEHVLIWWADKGFVHLAVDDGEQKPAHSHKQTPILVPDGRVDPGRIRKLFTDSSRHLPDEIAGLVKSKLRQYQASIV